MVSRLWSWAISQARFMAIVLAPTPPRVPMTATSERLPASGTTLASGSGAAAGAALRCSARSSAIESAFSLTGFTR